MKFSYYGKKIQNDEDNPHTESTRIPSLPKYYKILNNILLMKKLEENKFKQLKRDNGNITRVRQILKCILKIHLTIKS